MEFITIPSLQHQALVKLAFTFWNQPDVRASMRSDRSMGLEPGIGGLDCLLREVVELFCLLKEQTKIFQRRDEWQLLEDKVREKVDGICLPETLKKETTNFIHLIGQQILNWSLYHECYLGIMVKDCMDNLCWTFQGTIDGKKTAERLIEDGSLDVSLLYKLACTYCLEDYVYTLWRQMNFAQFHGKDLEEISYLEPFLIVFWSFCAEGKLRQQSFSDVSSMFLYAAKCGNVPAASYFMKKLTSFAHLVSVEEMVSSMRIICSCNWKILVKPYADIWCLLFSYMDQQEMLKVFKQDAIHILCCFLHWPYQNALICIVQRFKNILCDRDIYSVLLKISEKIHEGSSSNDYDNLFRMFWHAISRSHKRYAIEKIVKEFDLLLLLFKAESKKNIQLVLKAANAKERKEIIFNSCGMKICAHLVVYADKWDLLRFFITECLPSKENVLDFRKTFIWYIKLAHSTGFLTKRTKLTKLIQFFRDLIFSY